MALRKQTKSSHCRVKNRTMGRRAVLFALAVALLAEGQIVDAFTAPAIISLRAPSRRLVSDRRACPPRAAETRPKNQMGGRGRPAALGAVCVWCPSRGVVGRRTVSLWVVHPASRHCGAPAREGPGPQSSRDVHCVSHQMSPRSQLRMAEETAEEALTSSEEDMRTRGVDARRKSFFSRCCTSEHCTELCCVRASACATDSGFGSPPSLSFSSLTKLGCRAPSRNLSEEKINQKTYYDIEKRGELLAAPDRADEWGEELTEMGKWQRTNVRPPPVSHTTFFSTYFISVFEVAAPTNAPSCLCARAIRAHGRRRVQRQLRRGISTSNAP